MTFEISATAIRLILLGIVFVTVAIIVATRCFFNKQASINLTEKNRGRKWKSPLEGRNKYPEVDTFVLRNTFLNYGLMIAIGLMILAFSWTTYQKKIDISAYLGTLTDEIEMETPRTAEPPPPPPPPPPTAAQIVVSDMPDVESIIFEDQSIDEHTIVDAPVYEEKKVAPPPPPPPPPPMKESEREIFKVVEEQPMFPGCLDIAVKADRYKCSEEKMLEFIYSEIVYPTIARENGISGMVVTRFVVERDGSISNIEIIRDIGGGCGDEAMRVIKKMPNWIPGKQRGNPVRVMFTLPVKFVLN
ncbi:MAG: energy transducer TonB [Saprospiraceae bacterium]|nr:energy transducer TonB [Saprospiraceae bacterium]